MSSSKISLADIDSVLKSHGYNLDHTINQINAENSDTPSMGVGNRTGGVWTFYQTRFDSSDLPNDNLGMMRENKILSVFQIDLRESYLDELTPIIHSLLLKYGGFIADESLETEESLLIKLVDIEDFEDLRKNFAKVREDHSNLPDDQIIIK